MSLHSFIKSIRTITTNQILLQTLTKTSCGCQSRLYSNSTKLNINESGSTIESDKKKKKIAVPKITLVSGDNISITTIEEAQKLSKRRELKLVKIVDLDTKTNRPIYRLMTGAEYHAEDLKQRELKKAEKKNSFIKGEKVLLLNANITEHDLQTQLKKVQKWVSKHFEVRVVINGDSNNMEKAEKTYTFIESALKEEARLVQKRLKGSDIKFQILPQKKKANDDDDGKL